MRAALMLSLLGLCAGCISISTHEAQMRRCRETADRLHQVESDLSSERIKSRDLAALVAEQEAERQALQTEMVHMQGTYDDVINELKDDIDRGEVAVKETSEGIVITLDNQILFQSGRAELQKQGRRVLVQVAEVLRHVSNHKIQVQGHTDNVPIAGALKNRFISNWDLSAARAASVVRFLEKEGKVDPELLILEAYADKKPVAENSTEVGRKQNLRVDIVLVAVK